MTLPAAAAAALGAKTAGRLDHGLGDRLALGAWEDEDLADDEVGVVDAVGDEDVGALDVVARGDRSERVRRGDLDDEPGHGRDPQRVALLEVRLRLEVVRPDDGHRRDLELGGDVAELVALLDLVGPDQAAAVGDGGVDGDRLDQRAVVDERTFAPSPHRSRRSPRLRSRWPRTGTWTWSPRPADRIRRCRSTSMPLAASDSSPDPIVPPVSPVVPPPTAIRGATPAPLVPPVAPPGLPAEMLIDRGADDDRCDRDGDRALVSEARDQGPSVLAWGGDARDRRPGSRRRSRRDARGPGARRDAATTDRIP